MAALIGAITGGVSGLAQVGIGIADKIKAAKKQKEAQSFWEKNKYEIPESAKEQLQLAERSAAGLRLPGQDIMEENIGSTTAQGVEEAKNAAMTGSDVLGMLSQVYGTQMTQQKGIGLAAAQDYRQRQQFLSGVLGNMAQLEDKKWEENVKNPYALMLGQATDYGNRGASQINAGMGTLSNAASTYMQGQAANKQLGITQNYYGVGGTSGQGGVGLTAPSTGVYMPGVSSPNNQVGYNYSDFNSSNPYQNIIGG